MIKHQPPQPRLPAVPEEAAPVVQEQGDKLILLVGGASHLLSERSGRKLMEDLQRFYVDKKEGQE